MRKYLLANIYANKIVLCAIVTDDEMVEGIKKFLSIARIDDFDIERFYKKENHSAGEATILKNGTTLQYMILPE